MHANRLSPMTLTSLANIFPKWRAWAKAASENSVLRTAEYPFPAIDPKFLGYTLQHYLSPGASPEAPAAWARQFKEALSETLFPALIRSRRLMRADTYRVAGYDPKEPLAEIPDIGSLVANARSGLSIAELAEQDVPAQDRALLERVLGQFSVAAQRVIRAIDADRS
jgi:hypothetical protein